MKRIGIGNDGSFIVEITKDEMDALGGLAIVVEGKSPFAMNNNISSLNSPPDLTNIINIIKEFSEAKLLINKLKTQVDKIDKMLGGK